MVGILVSFWDGLCSGGMLVYVFFSNFFPIKFTFDEFWKQSIEFNWTSDWIFSQWMMQHCLYLGKLEWLAHLCKQVLFVFLFETITTTTIWIFRWWWTIANTSKTTMSCLSTLLSTLLLRHFWASEKMNKVRKWWSIYLVLKVLLDVYHMHFP